MDANLRALLVIGFCGGFSTFSTFSIETLKMIQEGRATMAILYLGLSVMLSLAALLMGDWLARMLA